MYLRSLTYTLGTAAALLLVGLPLLSVAALATVLSWGGTVGGSAAAAQSATGGAATGGAATGGAAGVGLPPTMLLLYLRAAATCPGMSWALLAAIGTVESANGTSSLPGVHSGSNPAGAEGPMQFGPATFARYDEPIPRGGADPPSPYDPTDAVFAAARMLCADGAGDPRVLDRAVYDYNHSPAYVDDVLSLAAAYEGPLPRAPDLLTAVRFVMSQIGTPYRWGGEDPGVAFDCSGLVQAAFTAAGVSLPRTAQAQFDAGLRLAPGSPLEQGDLVFFGSSVAQVEHVGVYVGTQGGSPVMVDAPHTGADVRIDAFPADVGAPWGDERYLGAVSPL